MKNIFSIKIIATLLVCHIFSACDLGSNSAQDTRDQGRDQDSPPQGKKDKLKLSKLNESIKNGDDAAFKNALSSLEPNAINDVDDKGLSPLHYAALYQRNQMLDELLSRNAKVDEPTPSKATALHYAAFFGNKDMAKSLIAKGANVNAADANKNTPLHFASAGGQTELIKLLEDNNADKEAMNDVPLWGALKPSEIAAAIKNKKPSEFSRVLTLTDDAALMETIINELKPNLAARNFPGGKTSLEVAIYRNKPAIARVLENHGAKLSDVDPFKIISPITRAADVAKVLDQKTNFDIDSKSSHDDVTLLNQAADAGNIEVMKLLIDLGANVSQTIDEHSKTITLLDDFATLSAEDFHNEPSYFLVIKTLLENGAKAAKESLEQLIETLNEYLETHEEKPLIEELISLAEKAAKNAS